MNKLVQYYLNFLIVVMVSGGLYLGVKMHYTMQAKARAHDLIIEAFGTSYSGIDEEILAMTRVVHRNFTPQDKADGFMMTLSPLLTSKNLPEFLRYPAGALETITQAGKPEHAANMLGFLVSQRGYKSLHIHVTIETERHDALLVLTSNESYGYVDPYYGVVALDEMKSKLTSPQNAQERLQAGATVTSVFLPLGQQMKVHSFYDHFATASLSLVQ